MLKIDTNLLVELGLGSLPEAEKNSLLKHIYETLEMRVGMRLADQMSNEQLDEFEKYFEAKDDAGAFKWLEANFPNYKAIVQEEFEKLKTEVGQSAPQILSESQTNAAQPQAPAPAPVATVMPQQQPVATPAPMPQAMEQPLTQPQMTHPSEFQTPPVSSQPIIPSTPIPAQSAPQPVFPDQQPPVGPPQQ